MTPQERAATAVRKGRASRKALRAAIAREIRAAVAQAAAPAAETPALRESEARFRAFVERASDVFWVLEFDLHFSYVSPSIFQLRGYTPEEVCRQRLDEIFTPASLRLLSETLQAHDALDPERIADPQISKTLELEQYVKGGGTVWTEAKAFYRLDARGRPTAILGVTRDIDARKRAEEKLRQSEQQSRATLDAMGDPIHVLDSDLRFVLINKAFVEWNRELGLETDVVGRSVFEIFTFLPARVAEEYRQVFRTSEVLVTEEHTPVGGKEYLTETRKIPIMEGGAVARVLTVIRDVTHRRRTEEDLRQREEEFRVLFNGTGDAMFVHEWIPEGPVGRILEVNERGLEWLGRPREELLRMNPGQLMASEPRPDVPEVKAQLRRTGSAVFETACAFPADRHVPVEIHARLITFRGRQAVLNVVRDITGRKQAERELREAHDQLELRVAERTRELQRALNELRDKTEERERMAHALRETEERLRTQYQGIPIPSYTWRKDGDELVLVDYNEAANQIAAGRMAEWKGRKASAMYASRSDIVADLWRCFRERVTIKRELVYHFQTIHQDRVLSTTYAFAAPDQVVVHVEDITERVRAEEALRASEARWKAQFKGLPLPTYTWQKVGEELLLREYNDAAVEITKGKIGNWVGIRATELYRDGPEILADIARCFRERSTFRREMLYRYRSTGESRFLTVTYAFVPPDLVLVHTDDVTERKRAEEALRESEERFRALFEQAADIILLLEVPPSSIPIIRDANAAALRLLGYERDELLGQPLTFISAEPQPEDLIRERRRGILSGKTSVFEAKHRRKDGTVFGVECSIKEIQVGPKTLAFSIERDITERVRAEEALRASEARFRGLVECLPALVYTAKLDAASTTEYISPQVEQLIGYSPSHYQANPDLWRRILHPDDRERVLAEVERCHATAEPFDAEYRLIARDGRVKWFHDSAVIVKDALGRPLVLQGVMYDITQRRQAEEAVRESEERYRALVETSPDAIIMVGPDGRILLANQQTVRMHGFASAQDMVGLSAAQLVAPEDRERSREDLRRLHETGTLRGAQRTFIRRDGSTFPVEISLSAVADADGRPLAFLGVGRDITERKQAERALRESEERYRTLVETSPDGILMIGLDHRLLLANPQVARMHGFESTEELRGRDVFDLVAPQDHQEARTALQRLPERGTRRNVRCTLRRKDGARFPAEVSLSVVTGPDHQPLAFLCISRDISEQRKVEMRERLQREQLRQADKLAALGSLVSGVAHEVSNPNHVIALNVNTLRSLIPGLQSVLDAKAHEHGDFLIGRLPYSQLRDETPRLLDDILGASNRIKRIVSDLKTYARPDTSELLRPFELNAAVTSAVELLRPVLQKTTRRFSMALAPGLPRIPGRGRRVEQVVVNLLQNACQSLRGPDDVICVSTSRSADGSHLMIEVRDEGEGIPPENLARLTDPFFTTKRDRGGTGLGLAVSAGIAQEHRGRLEFESTPGRGTTARLWLPISPPSAEEMPS